MSIGECHNAMDCRLRRIAPLDAWPLALQDGQVEDVECQIFHASDEGGRALERVRDAVLQESTNVLRGQRGAEAELLAQRRHELDLELGAPLLAAPRATQELLNSSCDSTLG